jgi:hypothetical protein
LFQHFWHSFPLHPMGNILNINAQSIEAMTGKLWKSAIYPPKSYIKIKAKNLSILMFKNKVYKDHN